MNLKPFLFTQFSGPVAQRLLRRANRTNGRGIPIALAGGGSYVQEPVRENDLRSRTEILPQKKVDPGAIAAAMTKFKAQMDAILTIPPPSLGGWQMLTKPIIQIVSPNTFYVEFSTPHYAKLNYGEAGNKTLLNELDTLVNQKRTIIFKLPDKVTISSNILNILAATDKVLKHRGGKLMVCASEQQTFLMLLNHNAGFNLCWDLDEALRLIKDENEIQSMAQGKTYFTGGYVYNSSKTP